MNLSDSKTRFHAQHINKCYCQNGNLCCCIGSKKSVGNSTSSHKFIKTSKEKGSSFKSSSRFHGNSSSTASSVPTLMTSLSSTSILRAPSSSEPRLTERRELYERSKGVLNQIDVRLLGMPQQPHKEQTKTELFLDDQIAKLQEFRLRNADECLSTSSLYSMGKGSRSTSSNKVPQIATERYTLNDRGLLESYNEAKRKNGTAVAIIADPKIAAKDILRQKLKKSKQKDKFLKKALCLPENSLALSYQKTY